MEPGGVEPAASWARCRRAALQSDGFAHLARTPLAVLVADITGGTTIIS